ncbi:MAG: TAXI family TRAP transporter solute-binding subunit [Elainellaceae cyanobacterium]
MSQPPNPAPKPQTSKPQTSKPQTTAPETPQNFIDRQQDRLLRLLNDRLFQPLDRLTIVLRLVLLVALTVWFGFTTVNLWHSVSFNLLHRPVYRLTFAVGDPGSESYVLGRAVQQVVEAHHPNIKLDVIETVGSIDSLQRLESGEAQLITAQADVTPGPKARAIATLYRDLFQLVVPEQSSIEAFTDLKGQRIGVPRESGQFLSFIEVANHFGLTENDFNFVGVDDEEAIAAFQHRVDAIFRVRAPGNHVVQRLVQQNQGRLVPLDQARAMKIQYPALEAATLPKGTYKGSFPAVPPADLDTVAVHKMLYASSRVSSRVVQEIAATLKDYPQEIADAIPADAREMKPLAAAIQPARTDFGIALHPGAIAAYAQNKPSFVAKNFDFLALLLSIAVPVASWIWELRSRAEKRGKSLSDSYVSDVIKLMDDGQTSQQTLEERQQTLYRIFDRAAKRLVDEDISQESFRTFNEAYKTAREKIEREMEAAAQQQQVVQRQKTAGYIETLIRLGQADISSKKEKLRDIDLVLQQVLDDLAHARISEESFRTFIEVYNTTKSLV